jgi:hypothetical protein
MGRKFGLSARGVEYALPQQIELAAEQSQHQTNETLDAFI